MRQGWISSVISAQRGSLIDIHKRERGVSMFRTNMTQVKLNYLKKRQQRRDQINQKLKAQSLVSDKTGAAAQSVADISFADRVENHDESSIGSALYHFLYYFCSFMYPSLFGNTSRSLAIQIIEGIHLGGLTKLSLYIINAIIAIPIEEWITNISQEQRVQNQINISNNFQLISICLIVPIMEELGFRGLMNTEVELGLEIFTGSKNVSKYGAALFTAGIFSSVHVQGAKLTTFMSSLAYTLLNCYTGGPIASIFAHIMNNVIAVSTILNLNDKVKTRQQLSNKM